ncbi:hypothetical protein VR45_30315 [Streptomyces sp. NRRL S-495]|nr:hypothetical protein VR45_30315 [Streptomyces sp. NRRL S-495]
MAGLQRPPQGHQLLPRSGRARRVPDDASDRLHHRAPVVDEGAVQVEEDHICHLVIIGEICSRASAFAVADPAVPVRRPLRDFSL